MYKHKEVKIVSPIPLPIISPTVTAFYADEMREVWQNNDRDWTVYSKKQEVSF